MRGSWNGGLQVIQVHGQMVTWEVPNFWKHPGTTMELSKKNDDHLLELRVAKMFRQTQMGCLDPLVPTAHHFRASFLGSCHLLNGRPDRMRCFRCFWLHFSVFNGSAYHHYGTMVSLPATSQVHPQCAAVGWPPRRPKGTWPQSCSSCRSRRRPGTKHPQMGVVYGSARHVLDQWYLCVWLVVWNIFFP